MWEKKVFKISANTLFPLLILSLVLFHLSKKNVQIKIIPVQEQWTIMKREFFIIFHAPHT